MVLFWGIFYTLVRLLMQIVCLPVCLHIQLFLKVMQKLCEELLNGIILVVQMHKVVVTSVTLPSGELFWVLFCPFLCIVILFGVPLFIENHEIASSYVFTDVLGITQRVTSLKKPFCSISPSAGNHFEVF